MSARRRNDTTIALAYDNLNRILSRTVPGYASGAAGYSVHCGPDLASRDFG